LTGLKGHAGMRRLRIAAGDYAFDFRHSSK